MHFDKLSNTQLYRLSKNKAHLKLIRKGAQMELMGRGLTVQQLQELSLADAVADENARKKLSATTRILAVAFPFFIPVHAIIAGRFLASGHILKWRQYWWFLSVGYVVWLVIVFLIYRP